MLSVCAVRKLTCRASGVKTAGAAALEPATQWEQLCLHWTITSIISGLCTSFTTVTYPGEQSFPLSHVVDELEGPWGAVHAAVHVTVEVQQSHLLLLAAIRRLYLRAAHTHTGDRWGEHGQASWDLASTKTRRAHGNSRRGFVFHQLLCLPISC